MTFVEVERSLTNLHYGFHDAAILAFELDAVLQIATISLSIPTGKDFDERYRTGRLIAKGVELFFVEPPDELSPFLLDGKGIWVDGDAKLNGLSSKMEAILARLPAEADRYRFFLDSWNSFLYLSARDVEFIWD